MRPLEGGRQPLGQQPGAHRDRQQHRCGRRPPQQRAEQLDGRRVRPVEVVEHEDERPRVGKMLEQCAHGTMAAVALVLERHVPRGRERGQRRKDVRELGADIFVETVEAAHIEPPQVLVERIHENRERQIPLELRCRAGEHEPSQRIRAGRELCEQTGFPDSRLPHELDRGPTTLIDLGEGPIEDAKLLGAPHEMVG